jgi:hypothetical protein
MEEARLAFVESGERGGGGDIPLYHNKLCLLQLPQSGYIFIKFARHVEKMLRSHKDSPAKRSPPLKPLNFVSMAYD